MRQNLNDINVHYLFCFQLPKDVKVNKKRSFVSDESSLAAQLGALRKN